MLAQDGDNTPGINPNKARIFREAFDPVTDRRVNRAMISANGSIDDMRTRGSISDRQKDAADRFLALYEAAHSDGLKAIDYSKVRVDGSSGSRGTPLDGASRALRELEALRRRIGDGDYAILLTVVVRGWSLRQLAHAQAKHAGGDESWKRKLAKQALIRALDALDAAWGESPIIEARNKQRVAGRPSLGRSRDVALLKMAGLA